jgi:hypothetical protein
MDTGLNENQAELAVLIFAVALKMLADGDGLDNRLDLRQTILCNISQTFLMSW